MRKYRLRVGLDVDDTVYDCNAYALSIINARHPDEEPVSINEITGWGHYGRHSDERMALYGEPEFVRTQPLLPGAQKFVHELSRLADIFFITAVPPACMTARAERLRRDFPEVPPENIIIGTRKDVMAVDILLARCFSASPGTPICPDFWRSTAMTTFCTFAKWCAIPLPSARPTSRTVESFALWDPPDLLKTTLRMS